MKKIYDILGVKTYSDPSYIFLGGQDLPTPMICASVCPILHHYRLPTFYVYFYWTNSVGIDEANFSKFCHTLPLRSAHTESTGIAECVRPKETRRKTSYFVAFSDLKLHCQNWIISTTELHKSGRRLLGCQFYCNISSYFENGEPVERVLLYFPYLLTVVGSPILSASY